MVKRTRITECDVGNFAALLERWSECETSYFIVQFWRSFGMSEMQFYKRLWAAQSQIPDFDYSEVKRNLKYNRLQRDKVMFKEKRPCEIVEFSSNG